ncbi:CD5 antigen-like [Dysidea avara]|uniref:CD5 antigen-like n=1 Tax=Dysidea avara TaxID=196820 RepID=UPI00332FD6FA
MFGIADQERSIVTGNVGCTGHETTLLVCPGFDPNAPTQCASDHTKDVGVICFSIYPVRLSDGTASSGHVEKFFNERWGTVCDDSFDTLDGQVVCSQLKQGTISRIANPMEFPVGTDDQPIWLDEVQCMGDERWLSTCPWR